MDSYNELIGFRFSRHEEGFVIKDKLIFVSYHNTDIKYAFRLSTLLIRYYRNIWLDRFEISPTEDWDERIRQARGRVWGAIVIVSDHYLQCGYCRSEYEYFRNEEIPVTAIIPRDFSTDKIAGFVFDDWIDFRRWFRDPNDPSVESLLTQIPQSEAVQQTGERLDYLRNFIQTLELRLSQMPTSRAWLYRRSEQDSSSIRPRGYQSSLLRSWDFSDAAAEESLPIEDLLSWSARQPQFILRGKVGSGKTVFAWLLALTAAHAALRDAAAPLPVWLDLMKWEDEHESVETYIEAQWGLVSYWKHWLESKQALFVLDNWNDLAALRPRHAIELANWVLASPNHRFVLLSTRATSAEPSIPVLQVNPMSGQLALKFSSGFLTLERQSIFRQIIRSQQSRIENNHVDYLSTVIELLASDRRLAVSQWQSNPLPALLALRHQQMRGAAGAKPSANKLLTGLQALAWHMMQQESHRFAPRDDVEKQVMNAQMIDFALEAGLLSEIGQGLRFQSEMFQWHLVTDYLKKEGLDPYLPDPRFTSDGGRMAGKWDDPVYTLVDSADKEARLRIAGQIAVIDPYLANLCLRRHPELYDACQPGLLSRLVELAAQNPSSQSAFRASLPDMPNPNKIVELLVSEMAGFDDDMRLWLWHEVLALPVALPAAFVNSVANINRELGGSAADALADYPRPQAAAYLVKLSQQENHQIRSNAIWMLGEIQYLAAAVLLLDCLQNGQADNPDEIALALIKTLKAEIYGRLLQCLRDHPAYAEPIAAAMRQQRRHISSRLLSLAHEGQLALQPQMIDIMVNYDEEEMALGVALMASEFVELPESLGRAISEKDNAEELRTQIAAGIERLPEREGWQELLDDAVQVIQHPPETMQRPDSGEPSAPALADSDTARLQPAPDAMSPEPRAQDEPALAKSLPLDDDIPQTAEVLDAPASDDATGERPPAPDPKTASEGVSTFTDEEKLLRTLHLLRENNWGRTQKAAKFLRRFAKHLRGTKNPNIIRLLCQALGDKSWHVRWAVAEALAWLRDPQAIPSLRDCLDDSNWIVQVAVIRSLVELGAKESAPAMTHLLQSPHKAVRETTAEALGALQNPAAIPALGQLLKNDPDYFVRFAAIKSIHQISPKGAREYLDYALRDRYIHVRWYAMKALAPVMDASDMPILARMAADKGRPLWEEKSIKDFAILALQRINTPESQALLEAISEAEKRNKT